ncbi:MAG TPA: C40 family peptidase [Gemmatimonadaceae bacterium]|jgi:cell wall-associated NlpC family hydrolase|nr:C40 family peptidase [Gemmatimonadaceae bacterium]
MRQSRLATRVTNILFCCLASGIVGSRAGAQGAVVAPRDSVVPKPFASWSASAEALGDSIVALARRQLGVRYRRGASSPVHGFDCSGLVGYVMAHFDIRLPRTSRELALVGEQLPRDLSALRPGDLLTFGHGKRISHVGIYIGDGEYVHASTPGSTVKEGSLAEAVASGWWKGARRVVALADRGAWTGAGSN